MGANVLEINDGNFDTEVLKADVPFLLDFSAVWCQPCKALAPVVEKVADEFNRIGEGLRTGCRYHRYALRNHLDRYIYQIGSLVDGEAAWFTGCSTNNYAVRTFSYLALRQFGKLLQIYCTVTIRRN